MRMMSSTKTSVQTSSNARSFLKAFSSSSRSMTSSSYSAPAKQAVAGKAGAVLSRPSSDRVNVSSTPPRAPARQERCAVPTAARDGEAEAAASWTGYYGAVRADHFGGVNGGNVTGGPYGSASPEEERVLACVRDYLERKKGLYREVEHARESLLALAPSAQRAVWASLSLDECVKRVGAELRGVRMENELLAREKQALDEELAQARAEGAETRQKLEELLVYALDVESRPTEPLPGLKQGGGAGVYVAFDSQLQQEQYRPNVTALVGLLTDPPVEIKGVVWEASELRTSSTGGEKAAKVLLYVTYCPNPRLCVNATRLKAFTDLPGVTVVFVILKRGVNSQLTDIRSARDMVPWLPRQVLHYGIDGAGLEGSDTPAGEMNVKSSHDLGALLRSIFPPPTPPRRPQSTVARPKFLPSPAVLNTGRPSSVNLGSTVGRSVGSARPVSMSAAVPRSAYHSTSRR